VTATPAHSPADPTDHPAPAAPAGQPAPPERPEPEGPQIVLSTDTEAQTDDPLVDPTNS